MLIKLALVLLCALILFQIVAACGAPVGLFTQGGKSRVLTSQQRVMAGVSVVILVIAALSLALKSGIIAFAGFDVKIAAIACVVLAIYFSLNVIMNLLSASPYEKMVMTPVAVILAIAFWKTVF